MKEIELYVVGQEPDDELVGSFILTLRERMGNRQFSVLIGMLEAQAIQIELDKIKSTRPMTHDLFTGFAALFSIDIEKVVVTDLLVGVYMVHLVCRQQTKVALLNARVSDAVAIALRARVPVMINESVLEMARNNSPKWARERPFRRAA